MRKVQHHERLLAESAVGMGMPSVVREAAVVAAGLALVCLAPLCVARNSPAGLADEQSAPRQVAVGAAKTAPEKNPQTGETQQTIAQPRSGAAEQQVNRAPVATYQDGELTIVAENTALSEVLAAVRAAMGADIDLPAGAAEQRIWVRLGPGPARQVLRDLLDGTELNYVIQASESDSEGIRSVLLTVRSKSPEPSNTATQLARGPNRRAPVVDASPEETSEPATPAVTAAAPASATPAPAVAAAADNPAASPDASPASPGVQAASSNLPATPVSTNPEMSGPIGGSSEQMMQQLQSMYEQRRQLQIQQNQAQKPQSVN